MRLDYDDAHIQFFLLEETALLAISTYLLDINAGHLENHRDHSFLRVEHRCVREQYDSERR